ncbi:MAG: glycosyltransferase [Verrucomicrobia bacterium]|nr:glycosyltransferase [Verrucomicrobiota bacterium]
MSADADLQLDACPVCRGRRTPYAFSVPDARVVRCTDCDFLFLNPQPSDEILRKIYSGEYFCGANDDTMRAHVATLKTATAGSYLDLLRQRGVPSGRLLEVGCGDGYQLHAAEGRGYDVVGIEFSEYAAAKARAGLTRGTVLVGDLTTAKIEPESFDVCVLADVIEHVRDPRAFLEHVWRALKPGGAILIATPSTDSWSARVMGGGWMEFKTEHMSYFSRRSLQSLLWQTGFEAVHEEPGRKVVSLHYVAAHFERYPVPLWTPLMRLFTGLIPQSSLEKPRHISGSGMLVFATKGRRAERPLLSIVVPAYNEKATVAEVLSALAAKQIAGLDKEIIVVESNSTDGTRDIVRGYASHPEFRLILEDAPRGKGAATRAGLAAARGDIVLIQDADLEYDLADYELLLEPIVAGRQAFVLGARHGGGGWKIRNFTDQPLHSFLLNGAHWGFTFLINVSLGIWLRDPFTMYKVFRRDCLHGLTFECNRFDFDWELLIKLVRRGYRPIELPVNYRSRSFKEGKKIRMIRDPLTWIAALLKHRVSRL